MTTKLTPPQKSVIMLLAFVLLFCSFVTMACDDVNPCKNGDACGLTAPAGEIQQAIEDAVKNSCQKDANGNCLTMDKTNHNRQCQRYDVLGFCLDQ